MSNILKWFLTEILEPTSPGTNVTSQLETPCEPSMQCQVADLFPCSGSLKTLNHPENRSEFFRSADLTGRSRSPSPGPTIQAIRPAAVETTGNLRRLPAVPPRKPSMLNLNTMRQSFEDRMPHVLTSPTAVESQQDDNVASSPTRGSLNFPLLDPSPSHSSLSLHQHLKSTTVSIDSNPPRPNSTDIESTSRCSSGSQMAQMTRGGDLHLPRPSRIPRRDDDFRPRLEPTDRLNFPSTSARIFSSLEQRWQHSLRRRGDEQLPHRSLLPAPRRPQFEPGLRQPHHRFQQRLMLDPVHQSHSLPKSFKQVRTTREVRVQVPRPRVPPDDDKEDESDSDDGDWC